ncbi:hypothetical protein [Knoellia koreensis]|uniref:Uncharacterized protein n=1 Tax=Knoellia koreensis TaxID=2730921 RepID=A0A849HCX0_9MICO|nr:hypothetical protein [Knoellia sp. DB2414S]NNM44524.1 hypothetical protein [Knoellia sp. DB2414S]
MTAHPLNLSQSDREWIAAMLDAYGRAMARTRKKEMPHLVLTFVMVDVPEAEQRADEILDALRLPPHYKRVSSSGAVYVTCRMRSEAVLAEVGHLLTNERILASLGRALDEVDVERATRAANAGRWGA